MPTVSVVVPNYNHARFLRQRIDTIFAQAFQDFELILLDDCSTDESIAILASYSGDPRVRMELNSTNSSSPFKQWNKGVGMARGEYVWIAESDDYADPQLLNRLVTSLDADSRIQFAYCRSWRVSEGGRLDGFGDGHLAGFHWYDPTHDFCMDGGEVCREYLSATNAIPNASAVLFRRARYEGVGGADETLHLCGDWKLWASMALQGKVAYVSDPLNYFRFHDGSVRSKHFLARSDVNEYFYIRRWLMDQVGVPRHAVLIKANEHNARYWVPAMLSRHVPMQKKREILRSVKAVDPHPMRSAVRFFWSWIWESVLSNVWYAGLKLSYRARRSTGLTREGISRSKTRIGLRKTSAKN